MAAILLVHGASHQPSHFTNLITALEQHGRQVVCPALPTAGNKDADMRSDVAVITSALTPLVDAGKKVVVLAHSYGGMVATNAVTPSLSYKLRNEQGEAGGVVHIVYMTAFMPLQGMSFMDAVLDRSGTGAGARGQPPPPGMMEALRAGVPEGFFMQPDPATKYYNDVQPEELVLEAIGKLRFQSLASIAVPTTNEGWRYGGGVTYIVTPGDQILPERAQRMMIEWVRGAGVEVAEIVVHAGHSPWMMHMETVRDVVLGVGV